VKFFVLDMTRVYKTGGVRISNVFGFAFALQILCPEASWMWISWGAFVKIHCDSIEIIVKPNEHLEGFGDLNNRENFVFRRLMW